MREKFNAWQTQVLELDGQEGVPKVTSPRFKSVADRECFETMSYRHSLSCKS